MDDEKKTEKPTPRPKKGQHQEPRVVTPEPPTALRRPNLLRKMRRPR